MIDNAAPPNTMNHGIMHIMRHAVHDVAGCLWFLSP